MHTLLENDLERLARTLVDRCGVELVCRGDNACTDGQRIVLPSMPDPLDEGLERMMVGYLDHEVAHVAFSDFQVAAEFETRHPGRLGMLNVVEDALIERKAMERWPGVCRNLDRLFAQVRGRVLQLILNRTPFDRFCTAIYLYLSHHASRPAEPAPRPHPRRPSSPAPNPQPPTPSPLPPSTPTLPATVRVSPSLHPPSSSSFCLPVSRSPFNFLLSPLPRSAPFE